MDLLTTIFAMFCGVIIVAAMIVGAQNIYWHSDDDDFPGGAA